MLACLQCGDPSFWPDVIIIRKLGVLLSNGRVYGGTRVQYVTVPLSFALQQTVLCIAAWINSPRGQCNQSLDRTVPYSKAKMPSDASVGQPGLAISYEVLVSFWRSVYAPTSTQEHTRLFGSCCSA